MTSVKTRLLAAALVVLAGCGGGDDRITASSTTAKGTTPTSARPPTTASGGAVALATTDVVTGLDTVWAIAWDPDGRMVWTERTGLLTRQGSPPIRVAGVQETGEAGLMGLAIDSRGRRFVMYTSATDNRVVRLDADGSQTVLVSGIRKATVHDGGRLAFGDDGKLYATTGDAGDSSSVRAPASRNGKILRIDPDNGTFEIVSTGHRNPQGLCFSAGGRLYSTEHGPERGDEVNLITTGFDGGWPETVGNSNVGANWTPTIAPAGCTFYRADLIPQWKGSMLFANLKDQSLRRLTFSADGGRMTGQEVRHEGRFGRLRDVQTGPDGALYMATSNRDRRGSPDDGDDRIIRIGPR